MKYLLHHTKLALLTLVLALGRVSHSPSAPGQRPTAPSLRT
jgi:hypothetical protein